MTAVYLDIPANMEKLMHSMLSNSAPEFERVRVKLYKDRPFRTLAIEGESLEVVQAQRKLVELMKDYIAYIPVFNKFKDRLVDDNFYTLFEKLRKHYSIEAAFIKHEECEYKVKDQTVGYILKVSAQDPEHKEKAVAKIKQWILLEYATDKSEQKPRPVRKHTIPADPPAEQRDIIGSSTNADAPACVPLRLLIGNTDAAQEPKLNLQSSTEQRGIIGQSLNGNAPAFYPGKTRSFSGNNTAAEESKLTYLSTEQRDVIGQSFNGNAPTFYPVETWPSIGNHNAAVESELILHPTTNRRDIIGQSLDVNSPAFIPGKSRHVSGHNNATEESELTPYLPIEQHNIIGPSMNVNAPAFTSSKYQ